MALYDNLYIIYYSGTGNSKRVSEWIADISRQKNIHTVVQSYQQFICEPAPLLNGKTLIGFCSATHGFNLPHSFLKLIFKFKRFQGSDVFIINTRAGMKLYKLFLPGLSGLAQILPAMILILKGYKIISMLPVDLPSNWISLHPGLRGKVVESIYNHWKIKIAHFSEKILSGKRSYLRAFIWLPLDIAIIPVAVLYYIIGRFLIAKSFVANYNCNNCGICWNTCPTKSIILVNKRPFWKITCESCMHCMNYCPQRAIETAHSFFIVLILITSLVINPFLTSSIIKLFGGYFHKVQIVNDLVLSLLKMGFTIIIFVFCYYLLHKLMNIKIINKFLSYSTVTHYKFWRRYKIPKEKSVNSNEKA